MPEILVRFRPEVASALKAADASDFFWKLMRTVAKECGIPVEFTEVNQIALLAHSNATCVAVSVGFDPNDHIDAIYNGNAATPEMLFDFCNQLRDKLIGQLGAEPLLQGCGVDIVSAKVLQRWVMSEYGLKNNHMSPAQITDNARNLVANRAVSVDPENLMGFTAHNVFGYVIAIPEKTADNTLSLSITIHVRETNHSEMEGVEVRLVNTVDGIPVDFCLLDAAGSCHFEYIPSGVYTFDIVQA